MTGEFNTMKSFNKLFVLTISLVLGSLLFAQDAESGSSSFDSDPFQKVDVVPLEDSEDLVELIEDDEIKAPIKAKAVARLGQLYADEKQKGEAYVEGFINTMNKVFVDDYDPVVRRAACTSTANFRTSKHAEKAIEVLTNPLVNDVDYLVVVACAKALGTFKSHKSKATVAILKRMRVEVRKNTTKTDDYATMMAMVQALGNLGDKKSYIPLMKVLQSRHPSNIKRMAHTAIDMIEW